MQISGVNTDRNLYNNMAVPASMSRVEPLSKQDMVQAVKAGETDKVSASQLKTLKRSGAVECATCASRKYQDGSNEGNVSFKAPGHIAPSASAGKVMAHEQEHVSNAVQKASKKDAKLMAANVTLKTAICPECGRSYVAGGTTHTMIKYSKDKFGQNKKSADYQATIGANFDEAV